MFNIFNFSSVINFIRCICPADEQPTALARRYTYLKTARQHSVDMKHYVSSARYPAARHAGCAGRSVTRVLLLLLYYCRSARLKHFNAVTITDRHAALHSNQAEFQYEKNSDNSDYDILLCVLPAE